MYDRQSQEEKEREKDPRDLAKRPDDARTVMTLREATVKSWLRGREGGTTWPRDDGNAVGNDHATRHMSRRALEFWQICMRLRATRPHTFILGWR